ncbi:hypothetical protein [Frigidibacter oleivorans]|uniref:hypothetical protein n=1 Tax=Frigidibacter oleivorans TaxID=2487129 RepID=UPI000F8DBB70|nr:hypothetical protein [Frigidibacter oleivorans]
MTEMTDAQIEAAARYCLAADPASEGWDEAETWVREFASAVVGFVACGVEVESVSPSAVHQVFITTLRKGGWTWGEVYDAVAKTHPSIVPWPELTPELQERNALFIEAAASWIGENVPI